MFEEKAAALFRDLGESRIMVLATSADDAATARSMSVIIYSGRFYFQTDIAMTKAEQIAVNPRVALCFQNYQVEGMCRATGHPMDDHNRFFLELFKKHYEGSYKRYSHMPGERVFEVIPDKVTVWNYENGEPCRDYYDFAERRYRREVYDTVIV